MSCFSGCPQKKCDLAKPGVKLRGAIHAPLHAVEGAASARSIRASRILARRFSTTVCSLGDSVVGGRVTGLLRSHIQHQSDVVVHSTSVNGHGNRINGSEGSLNSGSTISQNGVNGHTNNNNLNGDSPILNVASIENLDCEDSMFPKDIGMNRWIPQKGDRSVFDAAVFAIEMYVRDYELDQYNVVNHSIFVNYLDHARHEFLVRVGCHPDKVADTGKALAIIRQDMRYWAPLRARSKFRSTVRVVKITRTRCIWEEEIWKVNNGSKPDELIASAETEGICLNEDYRPIRIPKEILDNFEDFRRGPDICLSQ